MQILCTNCPIRQVCHDTDWLYIEILLHMWLIHLVLFLCVPVHVVTQPLLDGRHFSCSFYIGGFQGKQGSAAAA